MAIKLPNLGLVDEAASMAILELLKGIELELGSYYTKTEIDDLADQLVPVGTVAMMPRSTAPTGWLKLDGGTIGDASSGGTSRANADTLDLFCHLWDTFDNTLLPIQDSTGTPSVRGASAAADFDAHKRMPLFDDRGEFWRAYDDGAGVDSGRTLGSAQDDAFQGHWHRIFRDQNSGSLGQLDSSTWTRDVSLPFDKEIAGRAADPVSDGVNGTPRTASETRPRNRAYLAVIKY